MTTEFDPSPFGILVQRVEAELGRTTYTPSDVAAALALAWRQANASRSAGYQEVRMDDRELDTPAYSLLAAIFPHNAEQPVPGSAHATLLAFILAPGETMTHTEGHGDDELSDGWCQWRVRFKVGDPSVLPAAVRIRMLIVV